MNIDGFAIAACPNGPIEQRVPCPHCNRGPKDNALGVNIKTGAYHCFRCGWKGRAGGESNAPAPVARIDDPAVAQRKRERLRKVWRESAPLTDLKRARTVRTYLESRALGPILVSPPTALRAHPSLEYWDGSRSLGKFPSMVALFHDRAGEPVTLHATFLRADGCAKAAVPSPKKILGVPVKGATSGGAIRLYEPRNGVLGIAEGIETALSLRLLCNGLPVWVASSAGGMSRIHLPERLREIRIAVDIDSNGTGRKAADALRDRIRRWAPRTKIMYVLPESPAPADLNDELRHVRAH